MKKLLLGLLLILVAGVVALGATFTPATLPVGPAPAYELPPQAHPPADMKMSAIRAGKMLSQAGFAYRGGNMVEPRVFGMGGILVQHPQGTLLFDAGFGRNVDAHVKTIPWLMRMTTRYEKEPTVAEQLQAAGIEPSKLAGVVLTHAHWDHVSGVEDLAGVPVWVSAAEREFIRSRDPGAALAHSFGELPYRVYDFPDAPYLGFERSYDVFGDGAVVLVPAPGHSPGSIIGFVTLPSGQRYALVGDLVWQHEGIDIPAERPWISRRLVDQDEAAVRALIVRLHQLKQALPDLVIVPAHDRRVWDALPSLTAPPPA
jgi:glyoxylase-like metal-dependent hydrolase (beta-lactamase superfamily II)